MLPPGTKIQTTKSNGSGDWQPEAHKTRVWGREGIIIGHHDSHGLVYCVAHFRSGLEGGESTIAYYEPGEFQVLSQPQTFLLVLDQDIGDFYLHGVFDEISDTVRNICRDVAGYKIIRGQITEEVKERSDDEF